MGVRGRAPPRGSRVDVKLQDWPCRLRGGQAVPERSVPWEPGGQQRPAGSGKRGFSPSGVRTGPANPEEGYSARKHSLPASLPSDISFPRSSFAPFPLTLHSSTK